MITIRRLVAVATVLSHVLSTSVDCIINDIDDIGSALATVTDDVNDFEVGGLLHDVKALVDLQLSIVSLENTIETTKEDIFDSCPFNETETSTISSALLSLEGPINSTLTSIVSKKTAFDHALTPHFSVSPLVKADLKNVKLLLDELVAVFERRIPDAWISVIQTAGNAIDTQLNYTIYTVYADVSFCNSHGANHRSHVGSRLANYYFPPEPVGCPEECRRPCLKETACA